MANNESSFKREFKKSLKAVYGEKLFIRSNADWATVGVSDLSCIYGGHSVPLEAKFVKAPPKRESSHLLSHPLSIPQGEYLLDSYKAGAFSGILIAFTDCFTAIPVPLWPKENEGLSSNISWGETKRLARDYDLEFQLSSCQNFFRRYWDIFFLSQSGKL